VERLIGFNEASVARWPLLLVAIVSLALRAGSDGAALIAAGLGLLVGAAALAPGRFERGRRRLEKVEDRLF